MRRPALHAIASIAIAGLLGGPTLAQSPSPAVAARPAPSFTLASRGEAADDLFRLAIQTDAAPVTTLDVIHIQTTWSYLGTEPVRICTGGGGPVNFEVEQLDGFFDPGGGGDDSGRLTTVQPGTVQDVPFQKSGGYNASDPLAPQYVAWFDDPDLLLPAGIFRITAHAEYGVDDCGGSKLDASVVIEVLDVPGYSAVPTASPLAESDFFWSAFRQDLDVEGVGDRIGQVVRASDLIVVGRPVGLRPDLTSEERPDTGRFGVRSRYILDIAIDEVLKGTPVTGTDGTIGLIVAAPDGMTPEQVIALLPTTEPTMFLLFSEAAYKKRHRGMTVEAGDGERYWRFNDQQSVLRDVDGMMHGISPMPLKEVFPGRFEGQPFERLVDAVRRTVARQSEVSPP